LGAFSYGKYDRCASKVAAKVLRWRHKTRQASMPLSGSR